MTVYPKTFTEDDFVEQADGRFKATIPATTHNLGTNFHLEKCLRRDENLTLHSCVAVYSILTTGDFEFFVNTKGVYKLYLESE